MEPTHVQARLSLHGQEPEHQVRPPLCHQWDTKHQSVQSAHGFWKKREIRQHLVFSSQLMFFFFFAKTFWKPVVSGSNSGLISSKLLSLKTTRDTC